jgi:hypothetical protein
LVLCFLTFFLSFFLVEWVPHTFLVAINSAMSSKAVICFGALKELLEERGLLQRCFLSHQY